MTRTTITTSAGLIAVFSLALAGTTLEAGHRYARYQTECCQPVATCCQTTGNSYYSHGRRHHGYYGGYNNGYSTGYYRYNNGYGWTGNGYVGDQQAATCAPVASDVTPAAYTAPATTQVFTPQATCCGGETAVITPVQPASLPASPTTAPPTPIPGN